jgi:septal ring factor EnvC (AmiA/AmiB activator)
MQATRPTYPYPDTIGRGRPSLVRIPLAIALLSAGIAGMSLLPAAAQVAGSPPQATSTSPDAIKQRAEELDAARAQQINAAELQAKLRADLAAIGEDRSKLNQRLIEIAAQVRSVETRTGDAEARLQPLD